MGVTAVIGLQWGDEGKGKVVDAFCQSAHVAVRCQGGANAGHTVVVEGRRFVLHLIPSGILTEGTLCLIGDGVAVDLEVLDTEIAEIEKAGITTQGRLVLSRKAHLVLPLHKQVEKLQELARRGKQLDTTKRGIGPCYSDKYARLGIRVGDLLEPATLGEKLHNLCEAYRTVRQGEPGSSIEENLQHLTRYGDLVKAYAGDAGSLIRQSLAREREIILEGSQGFLLDIDHGTYPFVTSSNTGIHGVANGAGLAPRDIGRVVGVVKSYTTRVGAGPLPTLMEEPFQAAVREKGREYGSTTGRPRRCGWLDLTAIRYACALNGVTSVAVTKLDTLSGLEHLKTCDAYEYRGSRLDAFPADLGILKECLPVYSDHPAWGDITEVRDLGGLPPGASGYIDRILDAASADLEMVSVGPGREQLIRVAR
jgi:adenylosuccinate synthase